MSLNHGDDGGHSPRHAAGRPASRSSPGILSWVREGLVVVVIALVLSTLLRAFVVQVYWIPSVSMSDTLMVNDRIAVSRISSFTGDIERGDVVVFEDTQGWMSSSESTGVGGVARNVGEFLGILPADGENTLVKRVIGVGGDQVSCCTADGQVTVNGVPLDEPYLAEGVAPSEVTFDVVVPEGSLWVMGDNRSNSADSRYHLDLGDGAFVSEDDVVGRAVFVVWPVGHWSSLGDRDAFSGIPDPS